MRRTGWVIVSILIFSLTVVQCSQEQEESTSDYANELIWKNHHDSVRYVGMDACRACHSDKFETFQYTGMGQSFDLASKEKSAAKYHAINPVYDRISDFYYLPYWRNDSLIFKEYRLNSSGDTVHKREEYVSYIVGSGQHTNSHILNINGFLYQAPLTWYAQAKKWDLPPGFENGNNSRFNRLIGDECMSCHNALPQFDFLSENKFESVPHGIDCERCHGPGELHIQQKKAGNLVDISKETDYSIVNPAKLSWELQVDVCQRCHLQGNAVLEPGKTFHDFRPGMPLKSILSVYMPRYEGEEEGFIMASHAQRLQRSECFIQSNKERSKLNFTCINCHNPHVSVKVTGKKVFNAACMKCHEQEACSAAPSIRAKEEDNCVQCHMPANNTLDIPHVTVHDHYIRKPSLNKEEKKPERFAGLYAVNNPNPTRASKIKAYLAQYEKFERGNKLLLDSAEALLIAGGRENQGEWIRLAYLQDDMVAVAQIGASYQGNDPWTWYQIARANANQNNFEQAYKAIKEAVRIKPHSLEFQNEHAVILIQLNQIDQALKLLNQLLQWQPKQAKTLVNRGFVYEKKGDLSKAKADYLLALSFDPDSFQALLNLCRMEIRQGNKETAKNYLKRLQNIDNQNPGIKIIANTLDN